MCSKHSEDLNFYTIIKQTHPFNCQNRTCLVFIHFSEAAANVLTNPSLDPVAKIPELKVCAVNIQKT
jgi:anaerobic selenocysteine-containing dehydrogenase